MSPHHRAAMVCMVLGSAGTLAAVTALNEAGAPLQKSPVERAVSMVVQCAEPPKPKSKPSPPKKIEQRTPPKAPPPPAFAAFGAGLAGLNVGLALGLSSTNDAGAGLLGTDTRDVAMTAETVDEAPRVVRRGELSYPANLRKQGVEGFVVLSILVSATGDVTDVRVVDAAPAGMFEQAATDAVRGWSFQPGKYQGQAVRTWIQQRITFDLS